MQILPNCLLILQPSQSGGYDENNCHCICHLNFARVACPVKVKINRNHEVNNASAIDHTQVLRISLRKYCILLAANNFFIYLFF